MRDIIAIAILLFLSGTAKAAPAGNPFLRGVNSPAELASRVEASLALDPSGRAIIDDERCMNGGSCASPENFRQMFQEADPEAGLTSVSQVPAFLRSLTVVPAPTGEYWMACLKLSSKGTYEPVLHCLSRRFKPGEKAWIDSATRRIVLASDCTNPVERAVEEECAYISFTTKNSDTSVRFTYTGPKAVESDCFALKRAGEDDFEPWWRDHCPIAGCDFSGFAAFVGQPSWDVGSFAVTRTGKNVLRVPAEFALPGSVYRTALCLDRGRAHSDSIGVRWFDYRMKSGANTATLFYSKEEVPAGMPMVYWPWGEWRE